MMDEKAAFETAGALGYATLFVMLWMQLLGKLHLSWQVTLVIGLLALGTGTTALAMAGAPECPAEDEEQQR